MTVTLTALATYYGSTAAPLPTGASTSAKQDSLIAKFAGIPTTGTQSIVASSASDVTILASNASRKGAIFFNDSTAILYLLFSSGTSSATVFSQKLNGGDSFVLSPGDYTGIVKGIWASATGNARVTEFT